MRPVKRTLRKWNIYLWRTISIALLLNICSIPLKQSYNVVNAQEQNQQHHLQPPQVLTEEALELLMNSPSNRRAFLRIDPPVLVPSDATTFFDNFLAASHQYMRSGGHNVEVFYVDCAKYAAVCIRTIGTIPPGESMFARWWGRHYQNDVVTTATDGGDENFNKEDKISLWEIYDGPRNQETLTSWVLDLVKVTDPTHLLFRFAEKNKKERSNGKLSFRGVEIAADGTQNNREDKVPVDGTQKSQKLAEKNNETGNRSKSEGRGGVYIYNEPWAMVLQEKCKAQLGNGQHVGSNSIKSETLVDSGYFAIMENLIQQTKEATGLVVNDPEKARWFLIPFDVDASFAMGDSCPGSTHLSRLHHMLNGLQSSPYYKRHLGKDHVLSAMHWAFGPWRRIGDYGSKSGIGNGYFPQTHIAVIQRMIILRYIKYGLKLDENTNGIGDAVPLVENDVPPIGFHPSLGGDGVVWWTEGEDWRCTVAVPLLTNPKVDRLSYNTTFDAWLERPHLFHYRGTAKSIRGSQNLHDTMYGLRDLFPDSVFSCDATSPEEYALELSKSKFCLVLRGDDPERIRFNEAVAAGCIPVLINDGWELVIAPFQWRVPYSHFTVSIPESMFNAHPPSALYFAYGLPHARLRRMHAALMENRPFVVWSLNEPPDKSIGRLVWETIEDDCAF